MPTPTHTTTVRQFFSRHGALSKCAAKTDCTYVN